MLTVQEVLAFPQFGAFQLLAGRSGLQREIRCVTVQEAPYSHQWLRGGEFVLSSCYAIRAGAVGPQEWFEALHKYGVAAVGVHAGFLDALPDTAIHWADEHQLPVVTVPSVMTWSEVMAPIYGAIHRREEPALRPPSMPAIDRFLEHVEALTRRRWVFIDRRGSVTISDAGKDGPSIPAPTELTDPEWQLVPVDDKGRSLGWLATPAAQAADAQPLGAVQRAAIQELFGQVVLQREQIDETQRQFRLNLLRDLTEPGRTSEADLVGRGRNLGINLLSRLMVLRVQLDPTIEPPTSMDLSALVRGAFSALGLRGIADQVAGQLVAVLEMGSEAPASEVLNAVLQLHREVVNRVRPLTITIGMSRQADLKSVSAAFQESELALNLGRRLWGANKVIEYDRLGVYRLLDKVGPDVLADFYRETMSDLDREDARLGGALIKTVRSFLENQFNLHACARKLFVHPNTIKYRLGRIEHVAGLSLSNTDDYLKVLLALKIREMMARPDGDGPGE